MVIWGTKLGALLWRSSPGPAYRHGSIFQISGRWHDQAFVLSLFEGEAFQQYITLANRGREERFITFERFAGHC